MKLRTSSQGGFTLVEIMISVTIIGLLAAIAIPNFVAARGTGQKNTCISNLRRVDNAKHQWALEQGKGDTAKPLEGDLSPYLWQNKFPTCPAGGVYDIGDMLQLPICDPYSAQGHVLPF